MSGNEALNIGTSATVLPNTTGRTTPTHLASDKVIHSKKFKLKVNRYNLSTVTSERAEQEVRESSISAHDIFQRTVDVIAASCGLLIGLPILAAVAFTVKKSSPGPIFFAQRRLTKGGKTFMLYKFRSMRIDAETATGAVFATTNDPRVTSCGSFLRKTRLDELPQLWNVLRGDMSIIGPRPERPEIAELLRKEYRCFDRRLAVKAGLTGLGQVLGGYAGSMSDYKKKLAYDRLYIRRRSILLDLKIMLQTVRVVVSMDGAR